MKNLEKFKEIALALTALGIKEVSLRVGMKVILDTEDELSDLFNKEISYGEICAFRHYGVDFILKT